MVKLKVKNLSMALAATMLLGSLTGCSKKVDTNQTSSDQNQVTQTPAKQITLKYWTPLHISAVKIIKDFSENEAYKEKMKRTGVKIEFLHPPMGQEKEQYQLMIASNDLPDIIQHTGVSYSGGPDKAIADGVFLKLNDLIDKHAPNFKKLRETNKEVAKLTITDAGNIWGFPIVNAVEESPWRGPLLRKDFLAKANLEVPTTIDEWYTVLKAFKAMGVEAPLLYTKSGMTPESQFASAFGVANEFFLENGKVKYGPIEQGYKDYLSTLSKWYKEGLIDKDFATRDSNAIDSLIISNKAGAWIGAPDTGINPYLVLKKDDPSFQITGAPYPTLKKGDTVKIAQKNNAVSGWDAAITNACKYPEEAVKFMDFNYSQEGFMLFNYGIEGVSYKMVDNKPAFTDLMLKNPENLPYDILSWKYKLHSGPYLRDYRATAPFNPTDQAARNAWSKVSTEGNMPPVTHTVEESKKLSSIQSDLNTYRSEMVMKFILGIEPISKYDEFMSQLKKRGIDEVIAIKQAALDRFNKR